MPYGLTEEDLAVIRNAARRYPAIEQLILFGSRAKGNYKPGSDVDLAIKGHDIDYDTALHLAEVLNEETLLPYFFDVVHYESLTEPRLVEHIDRVGKPLLSRTGSPS